MHSTIEVNAAVFTGPNEPLEVRKLTICASSYFWVAAGAFSFVLWQPIFFFAAKLLFSCEIVLVVILMKRLRFFAIV